jgi:hypothetical protein
MCPRLPETPIQLELRLAFRSQQDEADPPVDEQILRVMLDGRSPFVPQGYTSSSLRLTTAGAHRLQGLTGVLHCSCCGTARLKHLCLSIHSRPNGLNPIIIC